MVEGLPATGSPFASPYLVLIMTSSHLRTRWIRAALLLGGLGWVTACAGETPTAPAATAIFTIVAPLCSGTMPATFYIDHVFVGADTFRVNLTPQHLSSRPFELSVGRHVLSAQVIRSVPDVVVDARAGEVVTDSISFYCS